MHPVRFGLFTLSIDVEDSINTAIKAERDGFYSVSANDHFFSPLRAPYEPQIECFTILTAIAARTKTIKIAPTLAAVAFRTPPLLAKIAATLDHVSKGRLIMGLGAGWQDREYVAHGYPFPSTVERMEQLSEAIDILKAMWTSDAADYAGKHFRITQASNLPRPYQQPHPPIMLGGSAKSTLQLAAKKAAILNLIPPTANGKDFVNDPLATTRFTMERLRRKIALLHEFTRDAGRDPAEIELGGLCLVGLSHQAKSQPLLDLAKQLGFSDYESAQRSPVALLGTPVEVIAELHRRIEETGITYYIVLPGNEESMALLVEEVMPTFS